MSFDIFVDAYHEGAPAGISREAVRTIFGRFVSEVDMTCWRARYDEANFCDLYLSVDPAEPKKISGFMISGPCVDERLWDALASVLKLGAVVLHFEGRAAFVGSPRTVSHLPKAMIEQFGDPRVISAGSEIRDAIEED
jgi:hypothetical protein